MSSSRGPRDSPPVRVGVDAAGLAGGKGIARYLIEVLPELAAAAGGIEIVALTPRGAVLPARAEGVLRWDIDSRPAIVWEQLRLGRVARKARLSLVHTLTDRLPVIGGPRSVVYLFEDPRYRVSAAQRESGARQRLADTMTTALFPHTLKRAALILTSSEATRRDVIARGIDEARVRVVYPGISKAFRPAAGEERGAIRRGLGLPDGYVLHLSSGDPRDNSRVALEAYAGARRSNGAAPPLVVVGLEAARLADLQRLARALGIGDQVRWLGYQTDSGLTDLYRAALAYVDPSLYEGFGFQVGEALASGIPVVCSNTTSLPEVVGAAGLLVPPADAAGFAAALSRVLHEPGLANELSERGPEQASRFTWPRAAVQTVEGWRAVLETPR